MNSAEEIIVKLTAQTGDLNAGMDEAAAKVKASTDAMGASVQSSLSNFRDFDNIQKQNIKTAQDVAAAQATLTAAQATGAYTTEELAAKQVILDAAMAKLPAEMEAASAATVGFTANSRVMGEVSTIVSEAMSGNFGRIRRSAAALANQTGILQAAFSFLLSPAGLVAAAFAAIGVAALGASEQIDNLRRAASAGGGFVGMPPGDIEEIAEKFKAMGFDIGTAREALGALASSGKVTSAELENLARASLDLGQITGESADKMATSLLQATNSGIRGIAELNEHYHFLNASQFDQIETLYKQGEATKAVALAFEQLAAKEDAARESLSNVTGRSEGVWAGVGTALANAWDSVGRFALGAETASEKIAQLDKQIKELQQSTVGQDEEANKEKRINDMLAQRKALYDQLHADRRRDSADASTEEAETNREQAIIHKEGDYAKTNVKDGDEAGLQQLQYAAQQQGHELSLAEEKAYWQQRYNIEKDGGAAEAQNAQTAMARVVEIQKQIDAQRLQSSKEAASKAAEATKQALREQQQAEDQEAQHVQELMRQEAEQTRELSTERAQSTYQTSLDSIEATKASYEEQYRSGQITVQELVALELQLVQQKLAAETNYYTQLKALDADSVKDVIKDQQGITDAILAAARERNRIQMQAAAEELQVRRRTAQEEAQLVASSINQLIFSNQTLKQRLASIGQDILSRFIEDETRKVAMAWASQGQQTAATVVGNQTRVAADQVGQAESLAVQGETAIKWIMTEAAKAAAGAFNAMVSIPYVGPFLAVGASIAAFATVAKLVSNVASAEGGWERVPADGMNTVLHKDEMVLPAHVANPVRDMAKRGGAGGDIHNHFHAADARSFIDMARRRPADLARMARGLSRRGYRV